MVEGGPSQGMAEGMTEVANSGLQSSPGKSPAGLAGTWLQHPVWTAERGEPEMGASAPCELRCGKVHPAVASTATGYNRTGL